ncbi:hypothetical protein BROOK1789B_882 [Bathymodiolus brooksi thiotrophic gill symbiont]|nr:hypothetical protein BROOK1789B_882 [Bathymodiolus brooksi thiotrophic gill symbiont]
MAFPISCIVVYYLSWSCCHGRSPIKKIKQRNNKKYQNRLQKKNKK